MAILKSKFEQIMRHAREKKPLKNFKNPASTHGYTVGPMLAIRDEPIRLDLFYSKYEQIMRHAREKNRPRTSKTLRQLADILNDYPRFIILIMYIKDAWKGIT